MKVVKKVIKKIAGWVNLTHPTKGKNQVAVKYEDGTAKFSDGTVVKTNKKSEKR